MSISLAAALYGGYLELMLDGCNFALRPFSVVNTCAPLYRTATSGYNPMPTNDINNAMLPLLRWKNAWCGAIPASRRVCVSCWMRSRRYVIVLRERKFSSQNWNAFPR